MSDALDECFARFTGSAVRLEARPSYSVAGEAERVAAWRAGQPRPERSVRTNAYLREVAEHVLAGRSRRRVRVIDHPLTEYSRYQMTGYQESQAVGEEILIAVREGGTAQARRELAPLPGDFWLFDGGTPRAVAVLMDYDSDGRFLGAHVADRTALAVCEMAWATVLRYAVPLNIYLSESSSAAAVA